jgi:hypothetical protein
MTRSLVHASTTPRASTRGGLLARDGASSRRVARAASTRRDALVPRALLARSEEKSTRALYDGGGGGGGGNRGGGGGGGGGNDDRGDRGRRVAAPTALFVLASSLAAPGVARAASRRSSKAPPVGDLATCFVYGFAWFYFLKLLLKNLFTPVAFFLGTMWILTQTNALPRDLGPRAYDAYVKPYAPREWTAPRDADEANDVVKRWERRFWDSVHRILPASDHPLAEKAFFVGVVLAGLV